MNKAVALVGFVFSADSAGSDVTLRVATTLKEIGVTPCCQSGSWQVSGVTIMVALLLTLLGLVRSKVNGND